MKSGASPPQASILAAAQLRQRVQLGLGAGDVLAGVFVVGVQGQQFFPGFDGFLDVVIHVVVDPLIVEGFDLVRVYYRLGHVACQALDLLGGVLVVGVHGQDLVIGLGGLAFLPRGGGLVCLGGQLFDLFGD